MLEKESTILYNILSKQIVCSNKTLHSRIMDIQGLPDSNSFLTLSENCNINLWTKKYNHWEFKTIISEEESYSLQRMQGKYSDTISAISSHPLSNYLLAGYTNGILKIFRDFLFINEMSLSPFGIDKIKFSKSGSYVVVSFSNNLTNLYSFSTELNMITSLRSEQEKLLFKNLYISGERVSNIVDIYNMSIMIHFLEILLSKNNYCLCLHKLSIAGLKLNSIDTLEYKIKDGEISGVSVHPSNAYIIILSNNGLIYIFHKETGELRGNITVPINSHLCETDSSGLFLCISTISNSQIQSKNYSMYERVELSKPVTRSILIYEVGTGNLKCSIDNLCDISSIKFSKDSLIY